MLTVAVILHCLAGVAMIGMSLKFITATPPVDNHGEILSGGPLTDEMIAVLGALYKAMGGAFAALGLGTILIALIYVRADAFLAKLTLLVMHMTAAWFATTAPKAVEASTGVRTPWRVSAGLGVVSALAFVFSLI